VAGGTSVDAGDSGVGVSDATISAVQVGVGDGGIGVLVGANTTGVTGSVGVKVGSGGVFVGCAKPRRLLKTTLNKDAKTM
jgi:hypothetical protein